MQHFITYDEVAEILVVGPTRASILLKCGLQVDLRVVPEESYGAALHYFTGSKSHNIAVRQIAQKRGLKINEYGVYRGKTRIAGETEESVYRAVDLSYIPPELRENRGENPGARSSRLPHLLELSDLRGDLHVHTKATDGHNTLASRWHSLASRMVCNISPLPIIHASLPLHVVLTRCGWRVNATKSMRLTKNWKALRCSRGSRWISWKTGAWTCRITSLQNWTWCSARYTANSIFHEQGKRNVFCAQCNIRNFTMLAHPSGRLIHQRPPYDIDMPRIIREAGRRGCFLELNAQPERLDLLDIYCQMAKEEGVLISINSDAHSTFDFENLRFGIGQARRGWLEKQNVLNTRSLGELRTLISRTMEIPERQAVRESGSLRCS